MLLKCKDRTLSLDSPQVMGVLNVTPDSFSDGGRFLDPDIALAHALQMLEEGASIIDIGGESTRPGAEPVNVQQELERVLPVIEKLSSETHAVISIDSMKTEVMKEAVGAGAHLINDVNALRAEGALTLAAETGVAVCLMHMQGEPRHMQENPAYDDVVSEVMAFLLQRVEVCRNAGISDEAILIDPGFGFGKTLQHNLLLMNKLITLTEQSWPVLVGVSRKSMLGALLDVPPNERIYGGVAAAVLACWQGAKIVRTHDVRATVEALKVVSAIQKEGV